MEGAPTHNFGEATSSFLLSRTVRDLLTRARLANASPPAIDIQSFVATMLSSSSSSSAADVVRGLFSAAAPALKSRSSEVTVNSPSTEISDGLWDALYDAQELRLNTGGNDQFVGLRYVVFAILTANTRTVMDESAALLSITGVDRQSAAMAIARYCMERHEPGEDFRVWQRILARRGLLDAINAWSGEKPPQLEGSHREDGSTPPPRDPAIALLQPDDPWRTPISDRSGAGLEAAAFADMIVATQFQPPFAVGIFGDWGSGKSYFMRLLYNAVADNRQRFALDRQTGGITFCQNVVQIRFNAWHYAEEKLWASLVDHIFTSLNQWAISTGSPTDEADKLFDQLTTARRLTIEAATELVNRRLLKVQATKTLATAETKLREKTEAAEVNPHSLVRAAFKSLLQDETFKSKLEQAADKLGLAGITDSAESLMTNSRQLGDEVDQFAVFRNGLARQLAAPAVFGSVVISTLVLPSALALAVNRLNVPMAELSAGVAGLVTPLAIALGWAGRQTKTALDVVGKFRTRLNREIETATEVERAQRASRAKDLADAEAAVLEARKHLEAAAASANDAELAYNMETGGGRVLRFIRDRVAAGDYAKHLSFVASIRRDFEELSRLLAGVEPPSGEAMNARRAHERRVADLLERAGPLLTTDEQKKLQETTAAPKAGPKVFERIILYVDDLDRCQPAQVVQVLQAVHLLLTFPLFVVFVAVDVRWVRSALANQYPEQLGNSSELSGKDEATTNDYLEKIFQIPYWVRPFGPDVTRALLADRMGPPQEDPAAGYSAPSPAAPDPEVADKADEPPQFGDAGTQTGAPVRRLIMTQNERKFIDGMAGMLDGLPRRTLRFINTYWIIKSGFDVAAQTRLEASGYRALIVLLAIAIEIREEYPAFASAILSPHETTHLAGQSARAGNSGTPDTVEVRIDRVGFKRPAVAQYIKNCLQAGGNPALGELQDYADIVRRHTFHHSE